MLYTIQIQQEFTADSNIYIALQIQIVFLIYIFITQFEMLLQLLIWNVEVMKTFTKSPKVTDTLYYIMNKTDYVLYLINRMKMNNL